MKHLHLVALNRLPVGSYPQPLVDCRVLRNPYRAVHSDRERKALVRMDPKFMGVVQQALDRLEGSNEVYIGCGFGKHRSVSVAEAAASMYPDTVIVHYTDGSTQPFIAD